MVACSSTAGSVSSPTLRPLRPGESQKIATGECNGVAWTYYESGDARSPCRGYIFAPPVGKPPTFVGSGDAPAVPNERVCADRPNYRGSFPSPLLLVQAEVSADRKFSVFAADVAAKTDKAVLRYPHGRRVTIRPIENRLVDIERPARQQPQAVSLYANDRIYGCTHAYPTSDDWICRERSS